MAKQPKAEPGGDQRLWQAVTADIAPLKRKRPPPATPPGVAPEPAGKAPAKQAKAVAKPAQAPPTPKPPELPPLEPGAAAGVDKRTAQRLRRGQLGIEARLDLHGLTQAEAHRRLDHFLAGAHETGLRNLLVITGKGRVSEEGGILRRMVPRWLAQPPNRARVIAVSEAQPKHGGAGALYVLVKRKR